MKKRDEIIIGLLLVLMAVIFFSARCAEAQVYQVPNYSGGLNLLDDSVNIGANQALVLKNFTLDAPNVLTNRQGYSYIDSSAMDISQEIDEIYVYEPYQDTKRMVIASNGGIYIAPSLAPMPISTDWDTLKIHFHGDDLSVTNGANTVYDVGDHDWWYSKMVSWIEATARDTVDISGTKYPIGAHHFADNFASITDNYAGSTDTVATYIVYKGTKGDISFTQQDDKLYISDSELHPIIYDDTSYVFMALIDSGSVDDTLALTEESRYDKGRVHLEFQSNTIVGDTSVVWAESTNVDTSYLFTAYGFFGFGNGTWSAFIEDFYISYDKYYIRLDRPFPYELIGQYWLPYSITNPQSNCVSDSGWAVQDSNKSWLDETYGTTYLQDFYAIDANSGYSAGTIPSTIRRIFCNNENTYSINTLDTLTYEIGDYYYVFSRVPFRLSAIDTTYKEFPRFEQIFFYNSQLYGFGFDRDGYSPIAELNYNRQWYSETGISARAGIMHRYIKPFFNFDIDLTDNTTVMFQLRGRGYIAAKKSIWSFTGSPLTNSFYLEKVLSNNGITDIDNWAKATEEYGYFANYNGVYRFDGVRANKISLEIDRAFNKYHDSRIVLGYFGAEQKLFLSFPDSNVTYFYDERFTRSNVWVGPWDFGMTAFYAPVDTNIFYFGHSTYKGRVFYYPNGTYYDGIPDTSKAITCVYESGRQSLTEGPWTSKRLVTGFFPVYSAGNFSMQTFADFSSVASDTFTSATTGSKAFRVDNLSATGDYFKVKISAVAGTQFVLRPYRLEYQEADIKQGD